MPINIQSDPNDHQRREVKRPPNYLSVGMRLKLGSLFAALILVMIMMKEARKPENWEWMGFEKANPAAVDDEAVGNKAIDGAANKPDIGIVESESKVERLTNLVSKADAKSFPPAGKQFWTRWFNGATIEQQRNMFRLLRAVVNRTKFELTEDDTSRLVENLKTERVNFDGQLSAQIDSLPDDAESKEKLKGELDEAKGCWREKILPAWDSTRNGNDITLSQQTANKSLLALLRESALGLVEDGSSLSRPDEGAAWLLCWEQALSQKPEPASAVQRIQLMSQPSVFRGERVAIDGWVRSARRLNVKKNELGLDHYYVLWIRPNDTNVGPHCVYVQNLPDGFAPNGKELTETLTEMNERVSLNAVFFKIRSYEAGNNEVLSCPLLLANSVEWNPVSAEVPIDSWTPPVWIIASVLLLMPLVAGFIAWWVFSSTETRRFTHGPNTQKAIDESLVDLKKNRDIQTDLERVQALEKMDLEIKSSLPSTDLDS